MICDFVLKLCFLFFPLVKLCLYLHQYIPYIIISYFSLHLKLKKVYCNIRFFIWLTSLSFFVMELMVAIKCNIASVMKGLNSLMRDVELFLLDYFTLLLDRSKMFNFN